MKMKSIGKSLLAAVLFGPVSAHAIIIDFDSITAGTVITNQIAEFTITSDAGTVGVESQPTYTSTNFNGLVNRYSDFTIDFTNNVDNLTFTISGENTASYGIDVTHSGGISNLVYLFDGDSYDKDLIDFSGFNAISSLFFNTDRSGLDIMVFDTFSFDNTVFAALSFDNVATVPEPTIAILMASGLIAFGAVRRKNRA